jgi:hypothetical protein
MWLVVLLVLAALGCTREHEVEVAIALGDLRPEVRVLELRVYRGSTCPSVDEVVAGVGSPAHAQVWRVDGAPEAVGRLEEGAWSFAAFARDASCAPLGFGCNTIQVGEDDGGTISLSRIGAAGAPCTLEQMCEDGLCVARSAPSCDTTCEPGAMEGRACCGDLCVETFVDRMNCGRCGNACSDLQRCEAGVCVEERCDDGMVECTCGDGRICPPSLRCAPTGDRCRPTSSPEVLQLSGEDPPAADCLLVAGVIWAPFGSGTGMTRRVGYSTRYERGAILRVADLDEGFDTMGDVCPDAKRCELALGQILVLGDQNGNGLIDLATDYMSPTAIGIPDVAIIWSAVDRPPGDSLLLGLAEFARIELPEGTLAGAALYRNTGIRPGENQIWTPVGELRPMSEVSICTGMGCMETAPADCLSRPRPFHF